jgi:hypothetical protein
MANNGYQNADQALSLIRNHYYGKYRGEVVSNEDPSNRGLIKVRVPSLLEEEVVWAMPCLPFAGPNMGMYMIPEPGALVWIEFEAGNINRAIWTGCFWAKEELPENEKGDTVTPSLKVIRGETGLMITMNDDKNNPVITLCDKDGSNIITIEASNGKIKLKASSTVVIEAPSVQLGGESATQPVVMGLDLMNYLLALEAWVVPKGPIPPPSAVFRFLSSKVKTL